MRIRAAALGLLLATAAACPLQAQNAREGFWASVGFGYGSAGLDCTDCTGERVNGTGLFLRLGSSSNARMLVGAELNRWTRHENNADVAFTSLMGLIQFYPVERAGFFLNAGTGFSRSHFEYPIVEVVRHAVGIELGAGYDIPISPRLFITPFALSMRAFGGGTTRFNGSRVGEQVNPDFYQLGFSLTWH